MSTVRRVVAIDGFLALKDEWDRLLSTSSINDAFLTWEWLVTWWKHYGERFALRLYIAEEMDRIVGIAPLMLQQRRVGGKTQRVLRNIGMPPPDVGGLLIDNGRPEILSALIHAIVKDRMEWDFLQLREIPPGGLDVRLLTELFLKQGFVADITHSRHYTARLQGSWQEYFKGLSRNLRRDLTKKRRRLEEQRGLTFRRSVGRETTVSDMGTVFAISERARHGYLYETQTDKAFHLDLAEAMASRGWLDLSFIELDGNLVAFRYGFVYDGCFEDWRTGFDSSYSDLSVGKIQLMLLLEDCFSRDINEFHFLRGDEDYKARWQVDELKFSHIIVAKKTLWPLLFQVLIPRMKRAVKGELKRRRHLAALVHRYDTWRGNR